MALPATHRQSSIISLLLQPEMETIEYQSTIHKLHPSASVKRILYRDPDSPTSLPSQLMDEVICEASLPLDWAHSTVVEPYTHLRPNRDVIFSRLEAQLTAIELTLGKSFAHQSILDLGCGSASSFDTDQLGRAKFAPWLARVLHKLGARVIGVDVDDLSQEPFKSAQIDLLNPEALVKTFLTSHFDLVHSSSLYTSPALQLIVTGDPWASSVPAANKLVNILYPQIERILKRTGCYLYSEGARRHGNTDKYPFPRLSHRLSLEGLISIPQ